MDNEEFRVTPEQANQTLAALLRHWLPGQSWSQVRKLIEAQRVSLNGEIWLDDARRLKENEVVAVSARPQKLVNHADKIVVRYIDAFLIVVEKPAGLSTVRHPAERDWLEKRRELVPTLDDLVLRQIGEQLPRKKHDHRPRLRIVQRLDKATSGLVVFARTVEAERGLGSQFAQHLVTRRYLALVPGWIQDQTIRSIFHRDRGDGRRGTGGSDDHGKQAITHITVVETMPGYTLVSCKLETGRTHQIRIHLAELGRPVCGDPVYRGKVGLAPIPDNSNAPRLALHATELGFTHPITNEALHWDMPLPADLREFLDRLRKPQA